MANGSGGQTVTLFLAGDVMTGRGIDQVLRHPSRPDLHEPAVKDAREYVLLAEEKHGRLAAPPDDAYIWGDALQELDSMGPGARVINLETSITTSPDYWSGKGIHYRMHPENVGCLTSARIDICTLANNHTLDYGPAGLLETVDTLRRRGIQTAGAGRNESEARAPGVIGLPHGGRLLVFAFGSGPSGVPDAWAAGPDRPGVDLLPEISDESAAAVLERIDVVRRPGDLVVASVHWGSNWGYDVPANQVHFATRLVHGGVDLVFGHSSHHPRPIERLNGKLVLYGCGDLINDYEGIPGYERYRGDLVLMYFATLDERSGSLVSLSMTPMQLRRFRLNRVSNRDARWLAGTIDRISRPLGCRIELDADERLVLV